MRALRRVALHAALVAAAVLTLLPLAWMVAASFMPAGGASDLIAHLRAGDATLAHYDALFTRLDLARTLANSAGLAATVTAISVLVNALAGYAFAKLRFAGRDRLFRGLVATLVIPGQLGMLPLFLLLKQLGLVNTYAGVVIPGIASVFGIFLVRQYALSIPQSLLDAARIDGAGELRIFVSIVLPLLRPILVTLDELRQLALHAARELGHRLEARPEAMMAPLRRVELAEGLHERVRAEDLVAALPFAKLGDRLRLEPEHTRHERRGLSRPGQGAAEECVGLDLLRPGQSFAQR